MDRRQKKTRRAVYDALATLLEEKNYSSITIQEIIDEANIGRSTFYSHFETKDELLRSLCAEIFDHVFTRTAAKERAHDRASGGKENRVAGTRDRASGGKENRIAGGKDIRTIGASDRAAGEKDIRGEITRILYHMKDSGRYIKRILSCESGEMFMSYLKEYLEKVFSDETEKVKTDVPRDYLLNLVVCDFAETVRWWMKHDEYSPEDVSRFFFSTTFFSRGY